MKRTAYTNSEHKLEVDLLRAIAVVSVILFHAGFLPGGYIGVDIFFVISGYLMAGIIQERISFGSFSIFTFYARRIFRVVPALTAVVVTTAVAGSLLLLPYDVENLGRSIIHAATFSSNMFFMNMAMDYFSADAVIFQPLLHTWSLSIEAQFYFLFPLLMVGLARFRRLHVSSAIVGIAAISFLYSEALMSNDPAASFYLLGSRIWEFMLGSLVFFWRKAAIVNRVTAWVITLLGQAMISLSLLALSPATTFPGVSAAAPVLGTMLLLMFYSAGPGRSGTVARVLSSPPIAWMARLSYSLYLWHWPLLVFARYRWGETLSLSLISCLLALALLLSFLTWKFIEQPFLRHKSSRVFARKLIIRPLAAPMIMIGGDVAIGTAVKFVAPHYISAGLPSEVLAFAVGRQDRVEGDCRPSDLNSPAELPCTLGDTSAAPQIFLWGNSFARMWTPALDALAREYGVSGLSAIKSACQPLAVLPANSKPECALFNEATLAFLQTQESPRTVVLAANWWAYDGFEEGLQRRIEQLQQANKTVFVVMNPPLPNYQVPRVLAIATLRGEDLPEPLSLEDHRRRMEPVRAVVEALQENRGVGVIDPATVMCSGNDCVVQREGKSLYYDTAHISRYGAMISSSIFDPVFEEILADDGSEATTPPI